MIDAAVSASVSVPLPGALTATGGTCNENFAVGNGLRYTALVGCLQVDGGKPLGQQHLAAFKHSCGGDPNLTFVALVFIQCTMLDTVRPVVSAFRKAEAVKAPADLFEKRGAGLIGGVFPNSFEKTDCFLFYICISCLISLAYVGYYKKSVSLS